MENQRNQEDKEKITTTVDVCGIKIDISSVLKDVTTSIKNNLKASFDDVFKDYELYKSTHDALLQIPFIKDLYTKNSELSLQVKLLTQHEDVKQEQKICEEDEDEREEPTITLNIHESFIPNNDNDDDDDAPADFLKTNKMNKKQYENDFELEIEDSESEQAEEEAEKEAEEEAAESEEEAEEEEEVYEIVIKNVTYFTTNEDSGDIYSSVGGDVGEIVGKFKNKKPVFMKRK